MVGTTAPAGSPPEGSEALMQRAVARAEHSRLLAPPNPWVGAILVCPDGVSFEGGTQRPGHSHAERVVLDRAGERARGATLYVTLEPCCHVGRTGPCVDAIIDAGVSIVVIALEDPDRRVASQGILRLRAAGVEVHVGVLQSAVEAQLRPYLHHRLTGRPWVVNKIASTLDGRTAAADGSSQWITGPEARSDVHLLRAQSDAILAGAGTIRADDPRLTVRGVLAPDGKPPREPRRIVLGAAAAAARVQPCTEFSGPLTDLLDKLGAEGVVQLMIEGGPSVANSFHREGLIDQYVHYIAAAIMGGDDGAPVFRGVGAASMDALWRGKVASFAQLGDTLRVDVLPLPR